MALQHLTLTTQDGFAIAATLYQADASQPATRALLISSATGAPRAYYRPFAEYLAERGWVVLTYDYRGIGDSKPQDKTSLQHLQLADWGRQDLAAGLQYLAEHFPHARIAALGHSIGGQVIALAANNHHVDTIVTVAAQIGYFGNWPGPLSRLRMNLITGWILPAAVRVFGELPAFAMGGVALPYGLALDWARWCQHPEYFVDRQRRPLATYYHQLTVPARFFGVTDDQFYAPPSAVADLARRHTHAQREVVIRHPRDWGAKQVGHFGFFRKSAPTAAWQEVAEALEKDLPLQPDT